MGGLRVMLEVGSETERASEMRWWTPLAGNTPSSGVKHQAVSWGGLNRYIYGAWECKRAQHSSADIHQGYPAKAQELTKFKAWTSPPALTWPSGTLKPPRAFFTRRLGGLTWFRDTVWVPRPILPCQLDCEIECAWGTYIPCGWDSC